MALFSSQITWKMKQSATKKVAACTRIYWARALKYTQKKLKTAFSERQTVIQPLNLAPQRREQDHIPNAGAVSQQHHQAVYAYAAAAGGGMPYSRGRKKSWS